MLTPIDIGRKTSLIDFDQVIKSFQGTKPVQLPPNSGLGSRVTLMTDAGDGTKMEIWVNVELPSRPANIELGFQENDVLISKGVSFYDAPENEVGVYGVCINYDEFLRNHLNNNKVIPSFNCIMSMLESYAEQSIPKMAEVGKEAWAERAIGTFELYSTMSH